MMRQILTTFIFIFSVLVTNAQVGLFEKPGGDQGKKKKIEKKYENRTDEQGRKQGDWMRYHPNGNPAYKARFKDGQPIDTLIRYYRSGKKFVEIVFVDDSKRAHGAFFSEKGNLMAEGFFLNMEKDSTWRFYNDKGNLKSIEEFGDDVRNGESRIFFEDGTVAAVVTYEDGEKEGLEKRFYLDGDPRIFATYKDGQMHGPYSVFFTNGRKEIEGHYYEGLRDSTWVFHDAAGNEKYSLKYDKGEPLNRELLDSMQREEFRRYEQNRNRLRDPEKYRNNPEEYLRGF